MSVIENNTTYYIQHVRHNWYVSIPKKYPKSQSCETTLKDENKYYQRWHVRFDERKGAPKFERSCFITEATEGEIGLDINNRPDDHEHVIARDVNDLKSWNVQDTAAKMKRKADRKKAANAKDADKEDTSDKDGASDPVASEGEAAKEDTSDKDGASDPEASKDEVAKEDTSDKDGASDPQASNGEAANVTAYTIVNRRNVSSTESYNWCVLDSGRPGKVTLLSNAGLLQWKFVKVEDAAAA